MKLLTVTTTLGHAVIGIALVVATAVITAHFFMEIARAIEARTLFSGFLHALGVLLLLWTMLELIQTELGFLRGQPIDVAVFVEVALVVVVREIILLPVDNDQPTFEDVGKWAVTAALLGLTYILIRFGHARFARGAGHGAVP
ncbi:MAG: phosphate-starvation-inducible PsiE family protein [Gammaproteobacteria bacterium]|nr:phosphate-starvation-inducible PsiE family protein [Gammaproteobacteria bacterium]